MKKLSNTKFHNFSGYTTFILWVSPYENIYKIWIFKFKKFKHIFKHSFSFATWFQMKRVLNNKVHNFSRCTTFIYNVSPFGMSFQKFNFSNLKNSYSFSLMKVIKIRNDSLRSFIYLQYRQLFILVIWTSSIVVVIMSTTTIHLSYSFMKLYKRYSFCEKN
jgi:hypothetical protein